MLTSDQKEEELTKAKDGLSHHWLEDENVRVFRMIALLKVKDIDPVEVQHMVDVGSAVPVQALAEVSLAASLEMAMKAVSSFRHDIYDIDIESHFAPEERR